MQVNLEPTILSTSLGLGVFPDPRDRNRITILPKKSAASKFKPDIVVFGTFVVHGVGASHLEQIGSGWRRS
jgi:hypothetical protein